MLSSLTCLCDVRQEMISSPARYRDRPSQGGTLLPLSLVPLVQFPDVRVDWGMSYVNLLCKTGTDSGITSRNCQFDTDDSSMSRRPCAIKVTWHRTMHIKFTSFESRNERVCKRRKPRTSSHSGWLRRHDSLFQLKERCDDFQQLYSGVQLWCAWRKGIRPRLQSSTSAKQMRNRTFMDVSGNRPQRDSTSPTDTA